MAALCLHGVAVMLLVLSDVQILNEFWLGPSVVVGVSISDPLVYLQLSLV